MVVALVRALEEQRRTYTEASLPALMGAFVRLERLAASGELPEATGSLVAAFFGAWHALLSHNAELARAHAAARQDLSALSPDPSGARRASKEGFWSAAPSAGR